jgi:hypothetical protein
VTFTMSMFGLHNHVVTHLAHRTIDLIIYAILKNMFWRNVVHMSHNM